MNLTLDKTVKTYQTIELTRSHATEATTGGGL